MQFQFVEASLYITSFGFRTNKLNDMGELQSGYCDTDYFSLFCLMPFLALLLFSLS